MKKGKYTFPVVIMAALLLAACGGGNNAQTTAAESTESVTMEETEAVTEAKAETETEEALYEESDYNMLQGIIQEVSEDGETFSFLADDGSVYDISVYDIGDIETDIEENVQIAIAYIGKLSDDLSGVTLVVALPEQEDWTFMIKTGVTTSNAMSSFVIETADGESVPFMKDNCPIESGALTQDDGDYVEVIYVTSQEENFPVEIKKAE